MVALGDSYTAGDLLPLDLSQSPLGCFRSAKAYPVLVAAALGRPLRDVACGGAGVKDMTQPQRTYLGTNQPQLQALSASDSVVLLTLGGDDMGFLSTLRTCMALSITHPWGAPCRDHYTTNGTDQLTAEITAEGPRVAAVLTAIRARAPEARIIVVGYPDVFPVTGGCWPFVPITDGDVAYLRTQELSLNAMLAADAAATGATYVDTFSPTMSHDVCATDATRDIEGLIPGSLTFPFHPNARGQSAIATAILSALQG